jgi:lipopolysaccharide transport system permease protein
MKQDLHVAQRLEYLSDLIRELVQRDLKIRYKRSVLGIFWALVVPLTQLLVFSFLFGQVLGIHVTRFSSYVFCGLLVWSWFQSSLALAAGAITDNRELIRRPGFPTGVLPGVTVATNLIHFLLALPVLILFLVLDGTQLTFAIVALPLLIALQFVLTLSLSYFIASLNVTFRDTGHLVGIALMLLFYLTPVFYEASAVPAAYQSIYGVNPLVYLLDSYRGLLLDGRLPGLQSSVLVAVAAAALLWLGHRSFSHASGHFAEEL